MAKDGGGAYPALQARPHATADPRNPQQCSGSWQRISQASTTPARAAQRLPAAPAPHIVLATASDSNAGSHSSGRPRATAGGSRRRPAAAAAALPAGGSRQGLQRRAGPAPAQAGQGGCAELLRRPGIVRTALVCRGCGCGPRPLLLPSSAHRQQGPHVGGVNRRIACTAPPSVVPVMLQKSKRGKVASRPSPKLTIEQLQVGAGMGWARAGEQGQGPIARQQACPPEVVVACKPRARPYQIPTGLQCRHWLQLFYRWSAYAVSLPCVLAGGPGGV